MADDDIKPDAEDSAEEVEAVACRDSNRRRRGRWGSGHEQPDAAAAEQPADEAQVTAEADAVADGDSAEAADAAAADPNLSDSDDDGADEADAERKWRWGRRCRGGIAGRGRGY